MKGCLTVFLLLSIWGCGMDSGLNHCQDGRQYSECLPPIFCVGTMHVEKPAVIIRDSVKYVISEKVDAGSKAKRQDVGIYLTDSLFRSRYRSLYESVIDYPAEMEYIAENSMFCDDLVKRTGETDNDIYDFIYAPRYFLVVMISDEAKEVCVIRDSAYITDCPIVWNTDIQTFMFEDENGVIECRSDYISGYEFSHNYVPTLFPVYAYRDRMKMIRGTTGDRSQP